MPSALPSCWFATATRILSIVAATAALHAQSATFLPRVDFGLGQENAQQSAVGDFDHDGNLDIAASLEGYNQGKVQVLFGDGQSDFGSSTEWSSYVAWGLCAADLNADGWLDLVSTSYGWAQHGVRIWLNDTNGGFTNSATVSTLATPPVGVAAGDLDGDGLVDLAAISESGGYAVDWFHGNGNGTFGGFRVVPNTHGLTGRRIYVGRFNADPHLDLLAIHQTGAMVLLNDSQGTGNFNASAGIPANEAMLSGAVADLDGDGLDDVITAGSALKVWHNAGNGAFTLAHSAPTNVGPLETRLGDLDRDGRLDALVVGLGGVQIHFGQPGGALGQPLTIAAGVYPKSGVIGDWNGDGWPDLGILCQNYAGQDSYLSIYEQVPRTVSATATPFGAGCGTPPLALLPDAGGRPVLGTTGRATIGNATSAVAAVALGWSNQWFGANPLPLALAPFGLPGCDLLQSADATVAATPVSATTLAFSFALPNAPVLLGVRIHLQAFAHAPGANPAQIVLSNGVAWVLGNG